MGPIFEELKEAYKGKPIRFVRFDFTNGTTKEKSRETGAGLGIKNITTYSQSTAVIAIVDAKSLEMVDMLGLPYTIEQMRERIDQALKM